MKTTPIDVSDIRRSSFTMKSLILLPVCVALVGCSNPLVGTWRNVQRNGRPIPKAQQLTTTFSPYGGVTIADPRTRQGSTGSYVLRNDRVTLTADQQTHTYQYQIKGEELHFDGNAVVFRREPVNR